MLPSLLSNTKQDISVPCQISLEQLIFFNQLPSTFNYNILNTKVTNTQQE